MDMPALRRSELGRNCNALTQYQRAYSAFLENQNNTYQRLTGVPGQGLGAAGGATNLISRIGGSIASIWRYIVRRDHARRTNQ